MEGILGCESPRGLGEVLLMSDDLGERESEAILKLLDLAKFAILAMLVATGAMGANALI